MNIWIRHFLIFEGKDRPPEKPTEKFADITIGGSTTSPLLRLCENIFYKGLIVILYSGFCILSAIIELKKRGVYASALIKRRKYWPKYIDKDSIDTHFEGKEVGSIDSLPGKMQNVPFHIFLKTASAYFLLSLPSSKFFCGNRIVKSTSKYPQATCTGRRKKVRSYCACSAGIL